MRPYYKDNDCVIYNCDAYDIVAEITCDVIITDPPYDMDVAGGGGLAAHRQYLKDIRGFTDGGFDMSILDNCPNWMCFCSKNQLIELLRKADSTPDSRWMLLTWNKSNPTPLTNNTYLPDTEYIVHNFVKGSLYGGYADKSRYIVHPTRQGLSHPNEKPMPVMTKLVNLASDVGQVILDPFMGSGTTLDAARSLGRKAIGVEREERYCEVAARRMQQGVLQL